MADAPRFLADVMLGRLARWLRILGYDTAFESPASDDHELVRQARAEGRILLTRDRELSRRRGVDCLFIDDEDVEAQLAQVVRELGLSTDRAFTRCVICNGSLDPVDKAAVRDEIPPYVYDSQERFARCAGCGRVYWPATHWQDMRERLARQGLADLEETICPAGRREG
ncbi:MAG: Mut7-C RNAse domain-containing protein [Chloroflexi bacterium]|nr:Mut7-C RNAse domain-containing protein [Chloroflexota bacterium]MBU1750658.1 Mut7-C RNAse domain-containing protein [Chloroflexota bacterium]MBU1878595.1 Mut7-C RNAse domain-containing protein [Chloroflexota bacterium]